MKAGQIEQLGLILIRMYKLAPGTELEGVGEITPPKIQWGKISDPSTFDDQLPPCTAKERSIWSVGSSW